MSKLCFLPTLALCGSLTAVVIHQDDPKGQDAPPKPVVIAAQKHAMPNAEAVAFSSDGSLVAAAFGGPSNGRFPLQPNGGGVAVWETKSGKLLHFFPEYGDILRVEFSHDGLHLAYARIYTPGDSLRDDVVRVMDLVTGKEERRFDADNFAWLPKKSVCLVVSRERISPVDMDPAKSHGAFRVMSSQALAVAPDGALMAFNHRLSNSEAMGGPKVVVKVLASKELPPKVDVSMPSDAVQGCYQTTFSPDGKLLATGHHGGIVRLWDTATLKEPREVKITTGQHVQPLFTPDGKSLLVCTQPANGATWSYDAKEPGGFKVDGKKTAPTCEVLRFDVKDLKETGRWTFQDGSFRTHYARFAGGALRPEANPRRFDISPDAKHLLAGCNGVVMVNLETGQVVRQFDVAGGVAKGKKK